MTKMKLNIDIIKVLYFYYKLLYYCKNYIIKDKDYTSKYHLTINQWINMFSDYLDVIII